ncbi:LPD1 domain-containing protein [Cupriavidus basilensis]
MRDLPVVGLVGKAKADHDIRLMVLGKHIRGYIQAYALCSADALRRECAYAQNRTYTQYAVSAHFDKKKAQPYWSQMRELTARAFGKLRPGRDRGERLAEDYLVHGTEESAHDTRPHSAYPTGRDRVAIQTALKAYLDVARESTIWHRWRLEHCGQRPHRERYDDVDPVSEHRSGKPVARRVGLLKGRYMSATAPAPVADGEPAAEMRDRILRKLRSGRSNVASCA